VLNVVDASQRIVHVVFALPDSIDNVPNSQFVTEIIIAKSACFMSSAFMSVPSLPSPQELQIARRVPLVKAG
jgi:hypothetical protein